MNLLARNVQRMLPAFSACCEELVSRRAKSSWMFGRSYRTSLEMSFLAPRSAAATMKEEGFSSYKPSKLRLS
jgi:hypothetical protein